MGKQFYIDYDRNSIEDGEKQIAEMLMSIGSNVGTLYVDFYAASDEIDDLALNQYVSVNPATKRSGWLASILNYKRISAYVCLEVVGPEHLRDIWAEYVYSSPKMYRINKAQTARDAALTGMLIEGFQQVPIEELEILLETNACVFRDFHDDLGLEVLCRTSISKQIVDSINGYLGAGHISS